MALRLRLILTLTVLGAFLTIVLWIAPALAASGSNLRIERGRLNVSRSTTGPALALDRLAIGGRQTSSTTITNSGSVAAVYTLSGSLGGDRKLIRRLRLTIVGSGPRGTATLFAGSLASFRPLNLGRLGVGEARTFSFRLAFPSTGSDVGDNALQGLAASLRFTWSAVQA